MLTELFRECLDIDYTHTAGESSFATRRDGDTLFMFFEASNGGGDWRRNLDFPVNAYRRKGKTAWYAHRGFLEAWQELEPLLCTLILDNTIRKIIITGYSHGAAIALLCHEYVWYVRPELRGSLFGYGFGCPRVIWGSPCDSVRERWEAFTVICNIDDIVTHLPPAALGYVHVGSMLKIGAVGKYSRTDAHRPENILTELKAYESDLR